MKQISFRNFMDYAEKLHKDAEERDNLNLAPPYIVGSILTSWMSLESFINSMMSDFSTLPEFFTIHERGFLEEKHVRFSTKGSNAGTFNLEDNPDYKRLEDKIMFLIAKAGKRKSVDKGDSLWQGFERMKKKRNTLSHHKKNADLDLTLKDSKEAIAVSKSVIEFVADQVWGRPIKW